MNRILPACRWSYRKSISWSLDEMLIAPVSITDVMKFTQVFLEILSIKSYSAILRWATRKPCWIHQCNRLYTSGSYNWESHLRTTGIQLDSRLSIFSSLISEPRSRDRTNQDTKIDDSLFLLPWTKDMNRNKQKERSGNFINHESTSRFKIELSLIPKLRDSRSRDNIQSPIR